MPSPGVVSPSSSSIKIPVSRVAVYPEPTLARLPHRKKSHRQTATPLVVSPNRPALDSDKHIPIYPLHFQASEICGHGILPAISRRADYGKIHAGLRRVRTPGLHARTHRLVGRVPPPGVPSAKGATSYQPGATPQEQSRCNARAEGPSHVPGANATNETGLQP